MGLRERVTVKPERVTITKLDNPARSFEAQFNPNELREALSVNYNRQRVPGLSHQPMQYINTNNEVMSISLFFVADNREQLDRNLRARRILKSFCFPRRVNAGQGVTAGGPPRVCFFWPYLVALTSVIINLNFTHTRFNRFMEPLETTVEVTLEEIRNVRMFDDDVFTFGTIRSPDAPGGLDGE